MLKGKNRNTIYVLHIQFFLVIIFIWSIVFVALEQWCSIIMKRVSGTCWDQLKALSIQMRLMFVLCFLSFMTIDFQLCTIAWPRVYQCNVPSHNLCADITQTELIWLEQWKSTQIRLDIPWDRTRVVRAEVRHSNHYATAALGYTPREAKKN